MAAQSLVIMVVLALALSSLGPMIDHHFAERHPGHLHLFFSPADVTHSHNFDRSHDHYASWMYGSILGQTARAKADGISFFLPNDGIGYGTVDLTIPFVVRPISFSGDAAAGILESAGVAYAIPNSATVAPPRRPPRA
jgi:hypothetical protein